MEEEEEEGEEGEGEACKELTEVVAAPFCFSIVATKTPQFYPDFIVI